MSNTTQEEQLKILLEMQDFQTKMDTVNKLFSTSIENAKKLGDVVDAISTKIDNLAAVAASANNTVNKTINNANTYTTNKKTTKLGGSKYKEEAVIGDTVYSFEKNSSSQSAVAARKEVLRALTEEANHKAVVNKKEQEYITKLQQEVELLKERAKHYKQESDTRKTNSEANMLREKTRAAHPELFAAGYLLKNPNYQFGRALRNIGDSLNTVGFGSDKIEGKFAGRALNILGSSLIAPAAGGAAALTAFANSVRDVGEAATKAFAEIESIKTQLGVVFSSQTQADTMFSDLARYATKSPFGVEQTSELAVLLKQSGVYASDLMSTLKMLGDTAGGNMEKMKRIANNYAQIVSIGKASMLDMRQFAYAGIPIFEAVSKELGVSQNELRKLISDGKVTADIIEKVFKDLTGINGIFHEATEKGAKTLKARLQNLTDIKQLTFASVGEYFVNYGSKTGNDSIAKKYYIFT